MFRFHEKWERDASLRLRDDTEAGAFADYDDRGRVRDGTQQQMHGSAVHLFLGDFLAGRDALLMTSGNAEADKLSRQVRDKLIEYGRVAARGDVILGRDGNEASVGDRIMARENWAIDTGGGRPLHNRDVLRLDGWSGEPGRRDAVVRRQVAPGEWSAPFAVPEKYLAGHAQLGYAATTHAAEGRTVDRGHMLIGSATDRASRYVGMSRGRELNLAYLVTSRPDQARVAQVVTEGGGQQRQDRLASDPEVSRDIKALEEEERSTPQGVWASASRRDRDDLAAVDVIRAAQDEATATPALFGFWKTLTKQTHEARYDQIARERLSEHEFSRYMTDPRRDILHRMLRAAELGGRDSAAIMSRAAGQGMAGADSIAAVLHGRVTRDPDRAGGRFRGFAAVTPAGAPPEARVVAGVLDAKAAQAGQDAAVRPPVWARATFGQVPDDPIERADWARKAGIVAQYRDLAHHCHDVSAVGDAPKTGDPERHVIWQAASQAAGLTPGEIALREATDGALYARQAAAARAEATAPADVRDDLRKAELAVTMYQADAQAARARGDARGHVLEFLAGVSQARRDGLRPAAEARRAWDEQTIPVRAAAGAAERGDRTAGYSTGAARARRGDRGGARGRRAGRGPVRARGLLAGRGRTGADRGRAARPGLARAPPGPRGRGRGRGRLDPGTGERAPAWSSHRQGPFVHHVPVTRC